MKTFKAKVLEIQELNKFYNLLIVETPFNLELIPGQFFNIKVSDTSVPLLRRPFSVCYYNSQKLYFMFDVHGEGTKMLKNKLVGDEIDLLGPLGNGFNINEDYDDAIIVAGGIGVAPFPLLFEKLKISGKKISVFLGGKTSHHIIDWKLENLHIATDDGSMGFKGNVVELLKRNFNKYENRSTIIYSCGPTIMSLSLQEFIIEQNIKTYASLESNMACGFGICQGCPVELKNNQYYSLICKEGPVFSLKDVLL